MECDVLLIKQWQVITMLAPSKNTVNSLFQPMARSIHKHSHTLLCTQQCMQKDNSFESFVCPVFSLKKLRTMTAKYFGSSWQQSHTITVYTWNQGWQIHKYISSLCCSLFTTVIRLKGSPPFKFKSFVFLTRQHIQRNSHNHPHKASLSAVNLHKVCVKLTRVLQNNPLQNVQEKNI